MEKITQEILRAWLAAKIKERGYGTQKALAEALGLEKSLMSRILKPRPTQGYRAISGDELIKMAEFFGEMPPGLRQEDFAPPRHEITALYEQFSPEQQQAILTLLKSLAPAESKK